MISSFNEWDPLRRVIVGRADRANWPSNDPVFAQESTWTTWTQSPVPSGPVPQHIIDEANEDLEILCDTLRDLHVEVLRPTSMDFHEHGGMYNYCPRDRFLVYGDTVIDPAMMYPCRDIESACYPNMFDQARRYIKMPRNRGMTMDAANVLRLNDKMLFLESRSGNRQAGEWLSQQFPGVDIHGCSFYSGVHIDSTITVLREGLVLLNASRVTPDSCPEPLREWDKIWIDDVVAQEFYQYPYASKWIALNMLSVDPSTVIVDSAQIDIIRQLESLHFTVIPLQLRHSRTLGGGFHCVTLDLWRQT